MKQLKRIPRWLLGTVFFGLIAIFLGLYIRGLDWSTMANLSVQWNLFVIGIVLGVAYLYLGAYVWRVVLRALGANKLPGYGTTTAVYAKAWMGRYVPGTVAWIAAKVYLASSWGISKSRLSVASSLEGGVQLLAFSFIGFLLLGFDPRLAAVPAGTRLAIVGLGLLVLIVLVPAVFNRLLSLAFRLRGKTPALDELRINSSAVLRSFSLYAAGALVYGTACFYVIWSLAPGLAWGDLPLVIGAFSLATVAGMAVPFAPGGIGVKDGMLLILLTAILPKETALAATILTRLWSVLIDVILLIISHYATSGRKLRAHA